MDFSWKVLDYFSRRHIFENFMGPNMKIHGMGPHQKIYGWGWYFILPPGRNCAARPPPI